MAFAETDLKLRSDANKGFTPPSEDLRLRSTDDKDTAVIPTPVFIGTNFSWLTMAIHYWTWLVIVT